MSAKYCKVYRCNCNDGTPCKVADDCFLFKWDIERELQVQKNIDNDVKEGKDGRNES